MIIRRALDADFPAIWPIFQQIVAAGRRMREAAVEKDRPGQVANTLK